MPRSAQGAASARFSPRAALTSVLITENDAAEESSAMLAQIQRAASSQCTEMSGHDGTDACVCRD